MPRIGEKVKEALVAKRELWPVRSNRASELGHPCLRYLYHLRIDWDKAPLPDGGLLELFEEGHYQEDAAIDLLRKAGYRIVEQQRPFTWDKYQITGHIDGRLLPGSIEGEWPEKGGKPVAVPFDIKGFSPWIWDSINSIGDMLNHRRVWMRKYPAQMTLYMLMGEEEHGVIILKDKTKARLKDLWMTLDWDLANSLVSKAEEVNAAVEAKEPPERAEGDYCHDCKFLMLCRPEIVNPDGAEILDNGELEALLVRRDKLAEAYTEYNGIDKQVKAMVKGVPKAVVGDFLISGKMVEKKGYAVEDSTYWKATIRRMG